MPLVKLVHVNSAGADKGFMVLTIDGQNKFFRRTGNVVFGGIDGADVTKAVWRDSGGLPPEIETSKLK